MTTGVANKTNLTIEKKDGSYFIRVFDVEDPSRKVSVPGWERGFFRYEQAIHEASNITPEMRVQALAVAMTSAYEMTADDVDGAVAAGVSKHEYAAFCERRFIELRRRGVDPMVAMGVYGAACDRYEQAEYRNRAYCPTCGGRRGVDMVAMGGTHRPYLICVNESCPDDSRTLDTAEAMAARRDADLLDAAEYWQEMGRGN